NRRRTGRIVRHKTGRAGTRVGLASLILACLPIGGLSLPNSPAPAPLLRPETTKAFQEYVQIVEARNASEMKARQFLRFEELTSNSTAKTKQDLLNGDVFVEQRRALQDGKDLHCPSGMIHHWEAAIFIPKAKLDDVLSILKDYDRHSEYYAPDVERSKTLSHEG